MKTKLSSKIIAALLIFFSVASLMPFTAEASESSTRPEKGTLVIHKYWMEDISEADSANDGTEVSNLPEGAYPLEGIEFTVKKILPDAATGLYPEQGKDVTTEMIDTNFTPRTLETNDLGIATFADLPQGVYIVTETNSKGADGLTYVPSDPFLVSVPMTSPDGNGWLDTVHVYPKNEAMTPGKEANGGASSPNNPDPSATEDHYITWTIQAPIPSTVDELVKYVITDKLDDRLDFVADSLTVYTKATKAAQQRTAVPETDYTFAFVEAENLITITFDENKGIDYLQNTTDRYVEVEFDTVINEEGLGQIIENDANLKFENENGSSYEQNIPDPDRPKVYTGIIGIKKVNSEEEGLPGAVFKVASSLENAKNGVFLKGPDGQDLVTAHYGEGYYELRGLYYGVKGDEPDAPTANKDFWIVEVQAPDGYSLLDEPVKVEFIYSRETDADENELNYFNKGMKIYNNKNGINLPMTGAAGILVSTVAGLVILAGVIIVYARRRGNSSR